MNPFECPPQILSTRRLLGLALLAPSVVRAAAVTEPVADLGRLAKEVFDHEQAFAQTMRDRDLVAFASFLADDAIFFTGHQVFRGKGAVLRGWRPFFEGPQASFSWSAEVAEPLESGDLALSSGPVRDSAGKVVSRFNSIWRRDPVGKWKVVFDKGCRCTDAAG